MAGRGPAPKPADKRARRNADPIPLRTYVVQATDQPALPDAMPTGPSWPAQTVAWWSMWAESPLSSDFTDSDWTFLLDTALLHAQLWLGDTRVAAELRQRVAKFGATPEDRARLRITFAAADEADGGEPAAKPRTARATYAGLRSVGGSDVVAGA
jgi:hypothetical protein